MAPIAAAKACALRGRHPRRRVCQLARPHQAREVKAIMHVVDMFPTLARLAGPTSSRENRSTGIDVWPTISEGKPSPRQEIVYNIEPFRAGVREGDWKLVWRTPLPSSSGTLQHRAGPLRRRTILPTKIPEMSPSCRSGPKRWPRKAPNRYSWSMLSTRSKIPLMANHRFPRMNRFSNRAIEGSAIVA